MNKNLISILLAFTLLIFSEFTLGQNEGYQIKDVTLEDMQIKTCSFDTNAPAYVIFDIGETEFAPAEGTFNVLYTRTLRMKILKKAGINYGEMTIPLYISSGGKYRDQIREIQAYSYNLVNGKIVKTKIDSKTIFEQKVSDHLLLKKFAFPEVHEGSLLEIKYVLCSPFKFMLHDWIFQWEIPVEYSECLLKYTPFYLYTYILKNAVRFDEYQEFQVKGLDKEFYGATYNEGACRLVMKKLPAFTENNFVSCNEEYLVKLHFQLNKVTDTRGISENTCSTWDELAKTLSDEDDFGKYIKSCQGASKQIIEDQKWMNLAPAERLEAIVSWVKSNFSWNESCRIFSEIKPKELLKRKSGTAADINLFLCGILRAAELESYPVLISTRGNVKVVKDYPFIGFFNYAMVTVKIDEKWLLTDGTEPFCTNTSYPPRCVNGNGLMVKGDKSQWVEIPAKAGSSQEFRLRLRFSDGTDTINARISIMNKGYIALSLRNKVGIKTDEAISFLDDLGLKGCDSAVIFNASADSIMKPYVIKASAKIPATSVDQMIEVNPFCGLAISSNPFDKPVRKYPVDVNYPKTITFIAEIILPQGYHLETIPDPILRDDERMNFRYNVQTDEGKIIINAGYTLKNQVYPADAYKSLQQMYNLIVKKLNEKLYLEKNS